MIHSSLVAYHDDLETLLHPIDDFTQHEENYNCGDVEELATSIEINGMYRPIYVQASTMRIIAGNHTWLACKTLGAQVIPAVLLDVDDNTALRIMVADNEIARSAIVDNHALLLVLEKLNAVDSLLGSGKKPHDLEVLRHLAEIPVEFDEYGQWPTITVQVPPHVKRAYLDMTKGAGDDRERFELMLRLAGWTGSMNARE